MRFYSDFSISEPTEAGKLRSIEIRPQSVSPKYKRLHLLIARELPDQFEPGIEVSLGKVGREKRTFMLFPPRGTDKNILVAGSFPSPAHRRDGTISEQDSSFREENLFFRSHGSGAWGSGVAFLVRLAPGERIVSNTLRVYQNEDGHLVNRKFTTQGEFDLHYGLDTPEML